MSEEKVKTSLYAVKITVGQERNVAQMLADRAKVEKIPVKAILAPYELRGYIIIEAYTPHYVDDLIRGVKHTRERVQGVLDISEIDKYLETKPVITSLQVGTDVEVIAGPFKGMQAKVIRVDESKNEITIEILEAAYTLPITVNADYVRELKKGE
ncbi:transcription elongation factor Spt5 [Candidatus Bathyarchaeota archaeon]|nr:transcription elongation factor Spt5 [Candidatus Bathyarchaeota archaeon]